MAAAKVRLAIRIALIGSALVAAIMVSMMHYDSIGLRLVFLVWTVCPYPMLWLLASRSKSRGTKALWCAYAACVAVFSFWCYALPRLAHTEFHSVALVLGPAYIIVFGIAVVVGFSLARWFLNGFTPDQPPPTLPSGASPAAPPSPSPSEAAKPTGSGR